MRSRLARSCTYLHLSHKRESSLLSFPFTGRSLPRRKEGGEGRERERLGDKREGRENERNRKTRSSSTVYRLDPLLLFGLVYFREVARFIAKSGLLPAKWRGSQGWSGKASERGEGGVSASSGGLATKERKGKERRRRRRSLRKRGGREGSFFAPSSLPPLPLFH